MEALVLSIMLAVGLWLVYQGWTQGAGPEAATPGRLDAAAWMTRLGLPGVSPNRFLVSSLAAGLTGAAVGWLALGWLVAVAITGAGGLITPWLIESWRAGRRRAAVQEAIGEVIARLRDGIRGGLSVPEALTRLASNGPAALRSELVELARELRLSGFETAITRARDRVADPLFDLLSVSLILNDRVGGRGISDVLDRLAHAVRAEQLVGHELRAYQARNVTTARIIAALPLLLLVAIRVLSPSYTAVFDTPSGQTVLLVCAGMVLLGYRAMLHITRLPVEPRVFGS